MCVGKGLGLTTDWIFLSDPNISYFYIFSCQPVMLYHDIINHSINIISACAAVIRMKTGWWCSSSSQPTEGKFCVLALLFSSSLQFVSLHNILGCYLSFLDPVPSWHFCPSSKHTQAPSYPVILLPQTERNQSEVRNPTAQVRPKLNEWCFSACVWVR